jgi:regulator of sigma E protease
MDLIFSYIHSGFYFVIALIILLGVLIFVHELGHFLVARWCGVRVEVFSLGFGKKIFKLKRGDTVYAVSLVPLGGYVKMFGEQPGSQIETLDKAVSFTHKSVWQRIAIVVAGPLMNFIFAVFVFTILAFLGEYAPVARVGDVPDSSPAYQAGLRSGDTIKAVNDVLVSTWDDVQIQLNLHRGKAVHLQVLRGPQQENFSLVVPTVVRPNANLLSFETEVGEIENVNTLSTSALVGVQPESKLKKLGLMTGDQIVAVNGEKVKFFRDLETHLEKIPASAALTLEIQRKGASGVGSERLSLSLSGIPEDSGSYSLKLLGLEDVNLYIDQVSPRSPAEKAGLQNGDRIVSVSGQPATSWEGVIAGIKAYDSVNPVELKILRDGDLLKTTMTPEMTSQIAANGAEDKRYTIGIRAYNNLTTYDPVIATTRNPLQAVIKSIIRTWDYSVMTLISFVRLIENKISPKNIGGIISIGQAASTTFQMGLSQFLHMMALISVNLFVLNLLPIPVLDGGHLVFYVIEAVKGSPVALKKMEYAQQIGIFVLMSLMAYALFNDFTRILGG